MNGAVVLDLNGDGHQDIIEVGNNYDTEVETVRYDAGTGLVMLGDGKGGFRPLGVFESGFFAPNNAKDLKMIKHVVDGAPLLLIGNNGYVLRVYKANLAFNLPG
jgi:hypothetical protein